MGKSKLLKKDPATLVQPQGEPTPAEKKRQQEWHYDVPKKAKVWFTPAGATNWAEALVCRAKDLFYESGMDKIIDKGDKVAIKIHCGEWNRNMCLRPELVAAIVEEVEKCGGEPFVTDTTTITYFETNSRTNAALLTETANRHGMNPASLGAPFVVGDGYCGEDDIRIDLPEGNILKESYIARSMYQADVCINLAHAKGHPFTSFGGCIKNFGIGSQSKRGKYLTHLSFWGEPEEAIGWPRVQEDKCLGRSKCPYWKICEDGCEQHAIHITDTTLEFDYDKCCECFACAVTCSMTGHQAITLHEEYFPLNQISMMDSAFGVMKSFKPGKIGYMAYAVDIAPECDCFPWADTPVTPDVGVFASYDLIAIETALVDMIDKGPIMPGSRAEQLGLKPGEDKFKAVNGYTPRIMLKAGEKMGAGTMNYELITYEPKLTPDSINKWQIRPYPAAVEKAKEYDIHNIARSVNFNDPSRRAGTPTDWLKGGKWAWTQFDPTA